MFRNNYLVPAFGSFILHAILAMYLLGSLDFNNKNMEILSKPVFVDILKEETKANAKTLPQKPITQPKEENIIPTDTKIEKKINYSDLIQNSSINELIEEEKEISEENLVSIYSQMIVEMIQSAWIKPKNIQNGLSCDLRVTINSNGRILKYSLIQSSGNIRFDNSALRALKRVETFKFFNKIPLDIYNNNFKNLVINFNPE